MNPLRLVLWALGLGLVLWGAWMLFFETGMDRWVSIGVLVAGLILFIGLAIMSFASSAATERETIVRERPETVTRERHVHQESRPTRRTRTTTRYE